MTKISDIMQLERIYRTNSDHRVVVCIKAPVRNVDTTDEWACAYTIEGLGNVRVKTVIGTDGIQAILLAMTYVATDLYTSEEYKNGTLMWDGGPLEDLGLPTAPAIQDFLRELRSRRVGL
jgi:hypothetical protein